MYDERPHVTRVIAYRNGAFERGARAIAKTLREMLSVCTQRLDLPFAARRVFNGDGQEILNDMDLALLPKDAIIYVSNGEAFQDPFAASVHRDRRMKAQPSVLNATGVLFECSQVSF